MDPHRWQQVDQLLEQVLDLPPGKREPFLLHSCGDDAELLRTLRELLEADRQSDEFLEQSALTVSKQELSKLGLRAIHAVEKAVAMNQQTEVEQLQRLGRYRIQRLIGKGAMGRVYQAYDEVQGCQVALKVLRSNNPRQVRRFQREARAQARIDHEHVCRVLDVGEHGSYPYIAMQLIAGASLQQVAPELSLNGKIEAVRQAALALQAAHDLGVIHRDVKPSNIMVEQRHDGSLKAFVLDFGIARIAETSGTTVTGTLIGTPAFMAPEQIDSKSSPVDRRSDLYSLGATLYTVLVGQTPFVGSQVGILQQVLKTPPPLIRQIDPGLPGELETIIHRCLEKRPEHRYSSTSELAAELQRFLAGEPLATAGPPAEIIPPPTVTPAAASRRRTGQLWRVGLIALLLLTLLLVAVQLLGETRPMSGARNCVWAGSGATSCRLPAWGMECGDPGQAAIGGACGGAAGRLIRGQATTFGVNRRCWVGVGQRAAGGG